VSLYGDPTGNPFPPKKSSPIPCDKVVSTEGIESNTAQEVAQEVEDASTVDSSVEHS
jgi:hypothetical protein